MSAQSRWNDPLLPPQRRHSSCAHMFDHRLISARSPRSCRFRVNCPTFIASVDVDKMRALIPFSCRRLSSWIFIFRLRYAHLAPPVFIYFYKYMYIYCLPCHASCSSGRISKAFRNGDSTASSARLSFDRQNNSWRRSDGGVGVLATCAHSEAKRTRKVHF